MQFQRYNQFSNIKRFFHLSSSTDSHLPMSRYYEKMEPVASMLKAKFQAMVIPTTTVSIDEIIVRFTSRSKHTIMIKKKPCPVRYNILALCEASYCYGFIFSSPVLGFFGLPSNLAEEVVSTNLPTRAITSMISFCSKIT